MDKSTIFSVSALIFMLWCSIPVQSADTTEAKVSKVMKGADNQFMVVVEDPDAKSDWALDIKQNLNNQQIDQLYFFMSARTDPKMQFEDVFGAPLCPLIDKYDNPQVETYLPRELLKLILTSRFGDCTLKKGERAIRASGQVHAQPTSTEYFVDFPKSTPYELETRIMTYKQANDPDGKEFLFKVNFNVGGDIRAAKQ